ncbi:MAG: hypothetical protein H6722_03700 [Sandaracinus sp.]|nr:hypothetical protein [Sandaracinus sp.]
MRATTTAGFSEGNGSCVAYDACADADVTLCTVDGGGHSWPGGAPPAGLVDCPEDGTHSTTFSASEAVWRFFAAHGR